ncbi:DUF2804 domain-containing protein [Mycetocola spongiae]|uniref:DUF2804 domain-containing protein n=1 Tax=Mycetocola spongiae TaxID=2859226 RepID=UPI001CF5345B|nr:DUF2804 domain-containing protein [Mycetocola spongiae]UCR88212.1 DUF2804 domain-containing protein [Mycetocola spongiae]
MSHGYLEREITEPIALCLASGGLNPEAVGFSRTPVHDSSAVGRSRFPRSRGRRWEYWALITPTHIVALTAASLDRGSRHQLWTLDRASGTQLDRTVFSPLGGHVILPGSLGDGPVRAWSRDIDISIDEVPGGTRVRAQTARVQLDAFISRPSGQESLGSVCPRGNDGFDYIVSDLARPVSGRLSIDGVSHVLPATESWAMLDHGRGRSGSHPGGCGAAAGVEAGRRVGLSLGEHSAYFLDGGLHRLAGGAAWSASDRAPWRVSGEALDLSFTPFASRRSRGNPGTVGSLTRQHFGHYTGWVSGEDGGRLGVTDLLGWAELPGH